MKLFGTNNLSSYCAGYSTGNPVQVVFNNTGLGNFVLMERSMMNKSYIMTKDITRISHKKENDLLIGSFAFKTVHLSGTTLSGTCHFKISVKGKVLTLEKLVIPFKGTKSPFEECDVVYVTPSRYQPARCCFMQVIL